MNRILRRLFARTTPAASRATRPVAPKARLGMLPLEERSMMSATLVAGPADFAGATGPARTVARTGNGNSIVVSEGGYGDGLYATVYNSAGVRLNQFKL